MTGSQYLLRILDRPGTNAPQGGFFYPAPDYHRAGKALFFWKGAFCAITRFD